MNDTSRFAPLGSLTFEMFGREVTYYGGPYANRPSTMLGVKMAKEIKRASDWDVPTEDFNVPPRSALYTALVQSIANGLHLQEPIYVGCMAGRGRTGLFMATLAYLLGEDDPVKFVRANYYSHAVETEEQERFVTTTFHRDVFRNDVLQALADMRAVGLRWFLRMSWADKIDYLRARFR